MSERYHSQLSGARILSFNFLSLSFELGQRLRRHAGWETIMARNRFYQSGVIASLQRSKSRSNEHPSEQTTLFAYSYAALELLRFARAQGWRTILGQIDPGPIEEGIVRSEHARCAQFDTDWTAAPAKYWEDWQGECALADRILVNSKWSYDALTAAGVSKDKLSIVPLAYEPEHTATGSKRYPRRFDAARPLRVLFLGQINLRKGVARLMEATRMLQSEPVEFWMVGPIQITNLLRDSPHPNCRWMGTVTRNAAVGYYKEADVFILPTLSDGFALTQLEAFEQHLPIIASAHCGRIVRDGIDGQILPDVSAGAIAAAIRGCLEEPERLAAWSAAASIRAEFTLAALSRNLQKL